MGLEIKQLTRLQIIRYCEKLEKENKELKEKYNGLWEIYISEANELKEENKKLEDDNRFLTKISKEYMEKENIIEITEFTELYKDKLKKENETLKDNVGFLYSCLDDRDKSIEIMKEEIKGLRDTQYTHGEPVVSSGPCL